MIGKLNVELKGLTVKRVEKEYDQFVEATGDDVPKKFKALAEIISA